MQLTSDLRIARGFATHFYLTRLQLNSGVSELHHPVELSEIGTLVAGWLFGVLTPGITAAIARPAKKKELLAAIAADAHETRYLLALVAHRVRAKYSAIDAGLLKLLEPVITQYSGLELNEQLAADYKTMVAHDPQALTRAYADRYRDQSRISIWPVPYHLPILRAHLGELTMFRVDTQALLLRVDAEVARFNEQVSFVRSLHDRTFAHLSDQNHAINRDNLEKATRTLGERAEIAVRTINKLILPDGTLLIPAR